MLCTYYVRIMIAMQLENLIQQKPLDYSTLYVDMNSFFASVEQYYNPQLRSRPVAVCAGTADSCTVLAASVEAKRLGIRTGTRVGDARKLCPTIVCTNGDHSRYKEVHTQFMEVLHNTICYVEARGIDEAFLKLPSWSRNETQATNLAKQIKKCFYEMYKEHIQCSIGLGANVWQAKMASNCQKPNGYTIITTQDASQWYQNWQLTDLNGVNRRMAKQLAKLGIQSPIDLYNASYWHLKRRLGVNGVKWYLRMRGVEVDVAAPSVNKMIGHQITTLPDAPKTIEQITTYCVRISTTLGSRLRKKELYAHYIGLHVSFINFDSLYFDLRLTRSISSDAEIILYSKMMLKKLRILQPIRRISMVLSNLTSVYQPDLPLNIVNNKQFSASEVSDTINNRFGGEVLLPASSFFARSIRLDRVGFGGDQVKESYKRNIKYL